MKKQPAPLPPMTEQRKAYAETLDVLVRIGLIVLVATFVPYVLGVLSPRVPLQRVSELWSLPLGKYMERTGARSGLWWLSMLGHADYLPLLGIAFLATCSIVCYLRIIPIFARNKNRPYLLIAILQVLVLLLSASGIL